MAKFQTQLHIYEAYVPHLFSFVKISLVENERPVVTK
jgi:hypothetical protein